MKLVLVASVAICGGSLASAGTLNFDCRLSAADRGGSVERFSIKLNQKRATYSDEKETGSAARDFAFDRKHPNSQQIMMSEDSKKSPFYSDAGTYLFIDKKMLEGRNGRIGVSTGQPNETDSGGPIIWFTEHFNCKLQ